MLFRRRCYRADEVNLMAAVPEGGPRPAGVVEAYAVMMREQIAPALRELGFKGSSGVFTMRRDGAHGEIRFCKDGRSVRTQILPFTVEVGYWGRAGGIGSLLPVPGRDTWWELTGREPAGPVGETVIAVLRRYAWPAVLAGLDDPAPQPHNDGMSYTRALWAGDEPDGGGADPSAWYLRPAGSTADGSFARFASHIPGTRMDAAYVVAIEARDDQRTVPALLDRLERDPSPVVRKIIASRMLTGLARDPLVRPAVARTAIGDDHPGVRWAARYAQRLLDNPEMASDHKPL